MGNRLHCRSNNSPEVWQANRHNKVYLQPFSRPTYSSELECHGSRGPVSSAVEYTIQYYDIKKYTTSNMWSVLYQCAGETLSQIFLVIELCLSTLHPNDIVNRFFSFVKVVKSNWHPKLSEENIEALLHIKKGLERQSCILFQLRFTLHLWWR